jgi:hypothetical protein
MSCLRTKNKEQFQMASWGWQRKFPNNYRVNTVLKNPGQTDSFKNIHDNVDNVK